MIALLLAAALSAACSPSKRKPSGVDCRSPESIRSFKSAVARDANPTAGVEDKWARCLCGEAADPVVRAREPDETRGYPAFPAFNSNDAKGSVEREARFFQQHLPVDRPQALLLVNCVWNKDVVGPSGVR